MQIWRSYRPLACVSGCRTASKTLDIDQRSSFKRTSTAHLQIAVRIFNFYFPEQLVGCTPESHAAVSNGLVGRACQVAKCQTRPLRACLFGFGVASRVTSFTNGLLNFTRCHSAK
jgi:hypothetical protein